MSTGDVTDRRDDEALAWVEQQLGGRIVGRHRDMRWRPQWFLDVETPTGTKPVLLRGFRNPGYVASDEAGSRATLANEAQILALLQSVPVPSPEYHGFNPELGWIAMERLAGQAEITELDDHDRAFSLVQDYMAALARVHAFPLDDLDLDGMPRPSSATQFKDELRSAHEAFFRGTDLPYPEPAMELGYRWLVDNELPSERPLGLALIDVGPNQFMFDGGRFTGFIDVEFGRIGDPLMEIGMMRVREIHYHVGRMREHLAHYGRCYQELTGIELDQKALQFWTIAGPTLFNTFTLPGIQRPDPTLQDSVFAFAFEVQQKRGLLEAVAEWYDFDLEEPQLDVDAASPLAPLHGLLVDQLAGHFTDRAISKADQTFTRYTTALARTLARGEGVAATAQQQDLDELAEILGHRPDTWTAGMAELQESIADDYAKDLERRVNYLYRVQRRREYLIEPMQRATGVSVGYPLERLH